MRRRRALAFLGASLLAACSPRHRDGRLQIGLVTDAGGLGDHSFSDAANAGLQAAARTFGMRAVVLQSRSPADYQPNLMALANAGFAMIFSAGYDQAHDLSEVAGRFPRSHFAIINAAVDVPNITSITFRSEEASFLAGALAALQSTTKTIGFLGGIDIPIIQIYEAGFAAGARTVDPAVRVLVKYAGDFNDVAAGSELSGIMYATGADIVFAAAGKAGLGMIEQVRTRANAYGIGVDADQDGLAPGRILTSVQNRLDRSVYLLGAQAARRQPHPRVFSVGLLDGGVSLTDFRYTRGLIAPSTFARLALLREAIVTGRIRVPRTRAELAAFVPPRTP
jgi:basic membrane protein A